MCFWNYLGWKVHTSFNSLDFKVRYILDNLIFGGKNGTLCTWSQWNKVNMMNESCEKMAAETDRGIPVGGFCLKWRFTALTGLWINIWFYELFQCIYYWKYCAYGNDFIIDCEKSVRRDKLSYGMLWYWGLTWPAHGVLEFNDCNTYNLCKT